MILQTILCVGVHLLSYTTLFLVGIVGLSVLATDCDRSYWVRTSLYVAGAGGFCDEKTYGVLGALALENLFGYTYPWKAGACLQIMIVTSSKYH